MTTSAAPPRARTRMEASAEENRAQASTVLELQNIWVYGSSSGTSTSCKASCDHCACYNDSEKRDSHTCPQVEPSCWRTLPAYPSSPSRARTQQKRTGCSQFAPEGDRTPLSDCVQRSDIEQEPSEPPTFHQEASAFTCASWPLEFVQYADVAPPPDTPSHNANTYTISKPLKSLKVRAIGAVCTFFYLSAIVLSVSFLYVEDTSCRQAFADHKAFECLLWVALHVCAIVFYIWTGINPGYIRKPEEYPEVLSPTFPLSVPAEGISIDRSCFITSPTSDSDAAGHRSNVTRHSCLELSTQHTLSTEAYSDGEGKTRRATPNVPKCHEVETVMCSVYQCEDESRCSTASDDREGKPPALHDSANSQRQPKAAHCERGVSGARVKNGDDLIDFGIEVSERTTAADVKTHDSLTINYQGLCAIDRRKYTFCADCRILQPLRTRHCKECDHCVLTYDHHCAFLGCCVGEFNHWRFYLFLLSQTIAVTWDSAATGLLAYHTYLMLSNQTTWEHLHRRRIGYLKHLPKNVFPFSQGMDHLRVWNFAWNDGDEIPFNVFDNDYYDCGC
ncbi:DHHC zinc finger domain-containing protein [Toxoplasma gondii GT1]|uniref:Palmitoyltransferase n=4 Tax=Toxoplasma gondii TaxID=5811 RepID=S7V195_TOXGG|nr:DHHC zinc finger domain-containing protein [Toxoplasma gondii GT1]KAF4638485.1 DHHC zinc finger domain-containing protein [Toxoplasma gondii]KFG53937.1 DHHC zinc finger domain-containing protein [Toxoplasma gondii FOU]RQX71968.1 DHHC zinc finger domain-containing protein [Toxoplasma gondii CAST]